MQYVHYALYPALLGDTGPCPTGRDTETGVPWSEPERRLFLGPSPAL